MNNILFIILAFQFIQPIGFIQDFETEFIPYVTIFILLKTVFKIILNGFVFTKFQVISLSLLTIFIFYTFITSVYFNTFSLDSLVIIYSPILCVFFTLGFYPNDKINPSKKTFITCWGAWVFTILIQYISPSIYDGFSSLVFKRNNYEIAERGLSGLSTEPSFAADVLVLFYSIWRLMYSSFSTLTNAIFIVTFTIAIILNGSATIYSFVFSVIIIEIIVKFIHSQLYKSNSLKIKKVIKNRVIIISILLLCFLTLISIFTEIKIPYRITTFLFSSNELNNAFSFSDMSIANFLYKSTLESQGSWRSIANFIGYYIGFVNLPFGGGLGSVNLIFSEVIYDVFASIDKTLVNWIIVPFSYGPLVVADLGFIFLGAIILALIKLANLKIMLKKCPLEVSIFIFGLISILLFSPKGSLSPWFIIIYSVYSYQNKVKLIDINC